MLRGMQYIVGLGNPGEKYENTRHNIGWLALDELLRTVPLPLPIPHKRLSGRTTDGHIAGQAVRVLYPDTFMNHSGSAVKKLVPQNEVAQLIVVHDDIDLGFGDLKVSVGRGDGSHNGVSSIIKELGNKSFTRVRIGIAPLDPDGNVRRPAGGGALERYVLGTFSAGERDQLPVLQAQAAAAIVCVVQEGAAAAMNTYNSN